MFMEMRVNEMTFAANLPTRDFGTLGFAERNDLELIEHLQALIAAAIAERIEPVYEESTELKESEIRVPGWMRHHSWTITLNGELVRWGTWLEHPVRPGELARTEKWAKRQIANLVVEQIREPRVWKAPGITQGRMVIGRHVGKLGQDLEVSA